MGEMHLGADFEGRFRGSSYMRDRLVCEYIRYICIYNHQKATNFWFDKSYLSMAFWGPPGGGLLFEGVH